MNGNELITHYPRLYHMAEQGSWESILKHGLLSTSALLALFDVSEGQREEIVRRRRPKSVSLSHPDHGQALVRDQIPLKEGPLSRALTDMTLEEWLEALNARVFFWLDEDHLETLLSAKAYRDRAHDVIHVETAALLSRQSDDITLSPINSGSTIYNPRPRGSTTFQRIADYPFHERRRTRGLANAVIELAVDQGVSDMGDVAIQVERRRAGRQIESVLWERPT
jgi:hypothetical protein